MKFDVLKNFSAGGVLPVVTKIVTKNELKSFCFLPVLPVLPEKKHTLTRVNTGNTPFPCTNTIQYIELESFLNGRVTRVTRVYYYSGRVRPRVIQFYPVLNHISKNHYRYKDN